MNIDDLMKLISILEVPTKKQSGIDDLLLNRHVVVRTYSAGCWFGLLTIKEGGEILLTEARRMYRWMVKDAKSISLSGLILYGIDHSKRTRLCPPLKEGVWLNAVEILPFNSSQKTQLESFINCPETHVDD